MWLAPEPPPKRTNLRDLLAVSNLQLTWPAGLVDLHQSPFQQPGDDAANESGVDPKEDRREHSPAARAEVSGVSSVSVRVHARRTRPSSPGSARSDASAYSASSYQQRVGFDVRAYVASTASPRQTCGSPPPLGDSGAALAGGPPPREGHRPARALPVGRPSSAPLPQGRHGLRGQARTLQGRAAPPAAVAGLPSRALRRAPRVGYAPGWHGVAQARARSLLQGLPLPGSEQGLLGSKLGVG